MGPEHEDLLMGENLSDLRKADLDALGDGHRDHPRLAARVDR
jgi:hypothetical protein